MTGWGPEDDLGPRHAEGRGTYFVSDFEDAAGRNAELKPKHRPRLRLPDPGQDPLDVALEDSDLPTANHNDFLAVGGQLNDPTPRVPYRARGEAQVRDTGPVSHRIPRRRDWAPIAIVPIALATIGGIVYFAAKAYRASMTTDGPVLAASVPQLQLVDLKADIGLLLGLFAVLFALAMCWRRR